MSLLWIAGWSSPVARQAHNLKVLGSNPSPATNSSPAGAGLFYADRQTLSGLCPAKSCRKILHWPERRYSTATSTTQCRCIQMDKEIPWPLVNRLEQHRPVTDRGAQIGKSSQATERRRGFLQNDRLDPPVRLIIPPRGILGSNPSPATNSSPAGAGLFCFQRLIQRWLSATQLRKQAPLSV
jgi:hypothetical protein